MKFKITRKAFTDGLARVTHVIPGNTPMPIIGNVCLAVQGRSLELTGTDMDLEVMAEVMLDEEADVDGSFTLPARVLERVIKGLPTLDLTVELDADKTMVIVVSGKSRFRIMGLKAEEFPEGMFATHEDPKVLVTGQGQLKDALRLVSYAMSDDGARYILNGVLFESEVGSINLVATDGRRASKAVLGDGDFEEFTPTIVPSKAIMEVMRLLGDDGEVTFTFSEKRVTFSLGDTIINSKVIEGNYPNYRQVMPTEHKASVPVDVVAVLDMVARVNSIQRADQKSILLEFTENTLSVKANSQDVGDATESLDLMYRGEPMAIGLNPSYLIEALRSFGKEPGDVEFLLIDPTSPFVIKRGTTFTHVLMPMRINN